MKKNEQKTILTSLKRLKSLLDPEKKDLWVIIVYGICSGFFSLVIPVAVQTLVNTIAFGSLLQPILVLTFLVFLILGFSALIRGMQVYIMEVVQQRLFARTALLLSEKIPTFKIQVLEKNRGPELLNRFFDVLTVQKSTALIVIDGISILLQTLVGMVLLAFYHPILLAFDLVLVSLLFGLIFFLGKGAIQTSIIESKKKYQIAGWLQELARLPLVFKHPKANLTVTQVSDDYTCQYIESRRTHFKILMQQIVGALSLQVLASSFLLGVGGWLVVKRQLTLGQLVAAELVVTSVVTGVGKFGKYLESYYDLVAAADKLGYLLDLPSEEQNSSLTFEKNAFSNGAHLFLENIHFGYSENNPVLNGINIKVDRGQKISILGKRGAGKTTFCDVLYGLRSPNEGIMEFNGFSLKDISLNSYRTGISYLKNVELFDGTILENLVVHNKSLELQKVYEVLEHLGIYKEIQKFSLGLNTPVLGGQAPLSSSQAKLVMLARSLLAQSELLIIDSFLDDLDDESKEKAIQTFYLFKQTTVLWTTGLSWVAQKAELLLTLENGKLK